MRDEVVPMASRLARTSRGDFHLVPWIRVVPEYQRAAVFRLGRIAGYRGPGLVFAIPFIESLVIVDLRIEVVVVPMQECITRDSVPLRIDAVVFFRVKAADKAIVEVVNYRNATTDLAQTTLRSVIGERTLESLLFDRAGVAAHMQGILDAATEEWGIQVTRVDIKDLEVPEGLRGSMAREAEAERERRAMTIRALGEAEAADHLVEAARLLGSTPSGVRMRYLQTLVAVAERGNAVVHAPLEFVAPAAPPPNGENERGN
jgi:regulator of protease activity HflC (stomatin/prohibitin superfamily)